MKKDGTKTENLSQHIYTAVSIGKAVKTKKNDTKTENPSQYIYTAVSIGKQVIINQANCQHVSILMGGPIPVNAQRNTF